MSLILYHNEEQKMIAEKSLDNKQQERNQTFITEIKPFTKFFVAEE